MIYRHQLFWCDKINSTVYILITNNVPDGQYVVCWYFNNTYVLGFICVVKWDVLTDNMVAFICLGKRCSDWQDVWCLYVLVREMFWLTICFVFISVVKWDVLLQYVLCLHVLLSEMFWLTVCFVFMCNESVICSNGKWYG